MADDDEWRFELEDLSDAEGEDGGDGTSEGLTAPSEIPVEPESWSLEGAAFVVLGVVATLFVFLRFAVG
ncbi:hypothetical protein ACFQE8_03825 [Salinirubellus sp. GCM10025818]|jgi:hypothetical protein|uniref:DUF7312 domain-containing protein n=1 Tax=Salinirubellus TaxID=2162630 RepID=UPI0030CDC735